MVNYIKKEIIEIKKFLSTFNYQIKNAFIKYLYFKYQKKLSKQFSENIYIYIVKIYKYKLSNDYILKKFKDFNDDIFLLFITDFLFKGKIIIIDEIENKTLIKKLKLKKTIKVFKYIGKNINPNDIEIWDEEQKIINLYNFFASKRLDSKINVKQNIKKYLNELFSCNINFHLIFELEEMFEKIEHLFSIALLYSKYVNILENKDFFCYNSHNKPKYLYYFTTYDWNYLLFCELTIEAIFAYWDRIAFLLYKNFNPKNIEENKLNLSDLIIKLNNEHNNKEFLKNDHFKWFLNLIKNENFKDLKSLRNKIVHYKNENGNLRVKFLFNLLKNPSCSNEIENLQNNFESLKDQLKKHVTLCIEGLDHAIKLIKN